jgi:hypothetical protein
MAVNRLTLIRPEFTLLRSASAQSQPRDLEVFTEFRRGLKERDRCRATDLGRCMMAAMASADRTETLSACRLSPCTMRLPLSAGPAGVLRHRLQQA